MISKTEEMEFEFCLTEQAMAHPGMEPQDVYKMIYQAVYGAEHMLQDREAAYQYFRMEYDSVVPQKGSLLWEQIGKDMYRVNLGAWKETNMPADWLFNMFAGSVDMAENDCQDAENEQLQVKQRRFSQYVEVAKSLAKQSIFGFSYEEFVAYSQEYDKEGPRAVRHSEGYRKTEQPAYRLVHIRYLQALLILPEINRLKQEGKEKLIVAIDGRCASGKSTKAAMLSKIVGASVIHMDDFYLPLEMRTRERLEEPGGNVHWERFLDEVMPGLQKGEYFSYRKFDCGKMELGEERIVPKTDIYIVEGAYSHHPVLGDYADIKVFAHVESREQLRRIEARDGGRYLPMFVERWIPLEEKYFAAYSIKEKADIRV